MQCPHCDKTIPDDVEFCIYCGERVKEEADSNKGGETRKPTRTIREGPNEEALRSASSSVETDQEQSVVDETGHLRAGVVVDGKYEVLHVLGEGGMGVVYLAKDIHTGVEVVIKAIRSEYAYREDFRQRILQEGRALAKIDHPNVVRLNAVVVEDEGLFLVMQYIAGESLADRVARYVARGEKMPLSEVEDLFSQVLQGVGAAHEQGVIHRDLKPPNILIRERDGAVKVTDFGIAKPEEDAKAGKGQTKGIIGSLHYMAPEQLLGHRDLDKRVDIYGLGILLFELLTGHVPFDGPSDYDIMRLHVEQPLPSVKKERDDVPEALDTLLQKACAKDREQRFASTEEFLEEFRSAVRGRTEVIADTVEEEPLVEALTSEARDSSGELETDTDPSEKEDKNGGSRWVWAGVAVVVVVGVVVAVVTYQMGLWEPLWDVPGLTRHHDKVGQKTGAEPAASSSAVQVEQPRGVADLVGEWKDEAGLVYRAVLMDRALELRLSKAGDLAKRCYKDGDARLRLLPLPGESQLFAVEDEVRPELPSSLKSDCKRARATCHKVWSVVDGKPLRAKWDGAGRLSVQVVDVRLAKGQLVRKGKLVVGCRDMRHASVTRVEKVFHRIRQ